MKLVTFLVVLHALAVQGVRIVQTNDDGWAEHYLRTLYDALTDNGHDVVLSAPADDMSGSGSNDRRPKPRTQSCIHDSCVPNKGSSGFNESEHRMHWVNSFPVTALRYGIETFGPAIWDGEPPELVVSGPNIGSNMFHAMPVSGTVGAASYSATEGIPAIAFSIASGRSAPWNSTPPTGSVLYADLATRVVNKLVARGPPFLPENTFLNVNFPKTDANCTDVDDFEFVLSRVEPAHETKGDVKWCGENILPMEPKVLNTKGCYISVSPADGVTKHTPQDERQQEVLTKLRGLLSCLPEHPETQKPPPSKSLQGDGDADEGDELEPDADEEAEEYEDEDEDEEETATAADEAEDEVEESADEEDEE